MKWIYVLVGDAREDEKPSSDLVMKFPAHYTQKNHDTCLFKSVASALHHLNKKQIASVVSSMAMKYMYTPVDEQLNKLASASPTLRALTWTHHWPVVILGASIQVFAGSRKHVALTY
jgi:hypothetical protein